MQPQRTCSISRVEGPEEVIVFSEYMVELARREVIGAAKDAGYTKEIRRKDRTILRHEAVWHGEVVLHDSGLVEVKRQPVQLTSLSQGTPGRG